jgi:transcriptional regulator with XRE-family HTH domain
MSHKLPNYLRAHRKRTGFSQADVAFLLGCRSGAKVSRNERFHRQPALEVALAYEIILRVPVRELFAGIADEVERTALRRARLLHRRLVRQRESAVVTQKLAALRAFTAPKVEEVTYESLRDR